MSRYLVVSFKSFHFCKHSMKSSLARFLFSRSSSFLNTNLSHLSLARVSRFFFWVMYSAKACFLSPAAVRALKRGSSWQQVSVPEKKESSKRSPGSSSRLLPTSWCSSHLCLPTPDARTGVKVGSPEFHAPFELRISWRKRTNHASPCLSTPVGRHSVDLLESSSPSSLLASSSPSP